MAKKKKRFTRMTKVFVEGFGTPKKFRSPSYKRMFRDARRTLEEKRGRGPRGPAKHWDETWVEYRKRTREAAREALLNEHVPERRCTLCGELRLRSRQWVMLQGSQAWELCVQTGTGLVMICKSCFQAHVSKRHKT